MVNLFFWLLAILMFGILVMLHEFGHFIVARLTGVKVEEFAVGFGPKILSRKAKSGVVYSWRALPFGGYCRFVGEELDDDDKIIERPDAYNKEKVWKRALISVGGPLMNLLTALVLLFLLYFAIGLPIGSIPVVDEVIAGLPAETAGFESGDRIVSINGVEITNTSEASAQIVAAEGAAVDFVVERGGEDVSLTVTPEMVEDEGTQRWMIGIQYATGEPVRFGFLTSLESSLVTTGSMATMRFDAIKDMITTREGLDNLSGPLGTVTAVKEQTQEGGLFSFVYLASVISVNLGLFNLLPIPGLDGSKLIFLLIEKIRGVPLDPRKEGTVTLIGFALLLGLMGFALYQDIARMIG